MESNPPLGELASSGGRPPPIEEEISRSKVRGASPLQSGVTGRSDRDDRVPSPPDHGLIPPELHGFRRAVYAPPGLGRAQDERLRSFRDARLIGRHPIAFTSGGEPIGQSIFRTDERTISALGSLTRGDGIALRLPRRVMTQRIRGRACLLSSGWNAFGHWIPEHLLKVRSLQEKGVDTSDLAFIVRDPSEAFRSALLAAAGIRPDRIIPWRGGWALVEELLVPDYPEITPPRLRWVSELGIPGPPATAASGPRVHLSRQNQRTRVIVNISEVEATLARNGFTTVLPEELSLSEQVAIARSARVLFGPQGSAFTLQIFMPPGGTVIEAFGRDRVHLFNRQVATVIGHEHLVLPDPRGPVDVGSGATDVVVDIGALESVLGGLDAALL